jgi:hypothetical protein
VKESSIYRWWSHRGGEGGSCSLARPEVAVIDSVAIAWSCQHCAVTVAAANGGGVVVSVELSLLLLFKAWLGSLFVRRRSVHGLLWPEPSGTPGMQA